MKLGSILYLAVPDKDYNFDKNRRLTKNYHLWDDYLKKESSLSIEHLNDFILNITKDHIEPWRRAMMYFNDDKIPSDRFIREKIYEMHRKRSIHVHVWNQKTFDDFLNFVIAKLNLGIEIPEKSDSSKSEGEMIYILKKLF
jgi:hypothetical protein